VALTSQATVTLLRNADLRHPDFTGQPSPSMIHWFPTLVAGTFTGQLQAAWNVTGNSQYVVMGGEFPSVTAGRNRGSCASRPPL